MDGCTAASAFFRILLPLSTPALAIAFLFAFTYAWSEFLLASTLIDDVALRPWTLGLMEFSGSYDARWGLFAAGSVIIGNISEKAIIPRKYYHNHPTIQEHRSRTLALSKSHMVRLSA